MTLVLALVLAIDGGSPVAESPYDVCPEGPQPEKVDGGWLLSDARGARNACLLATCRALQTEQPAPVMAFSQGSWVLAVSLSIIALGVGAWGGWSLARLIYSR